MKFVGGEVIAGLEKRTQDRVPLRGLLESDLLEMPVQDVLGLADHLARKAGLIINALLQHGFGCPRR